MSDRYLVISSDCHAGLACEDYRPYLEERFSPAFDEFLAEHPEFKLEEPPRTFDESSLKNDVTYWPSGWLLREA